MVWSRIGARLSGRSGILELMDDLGQALADGTDTVAMMGGGNPAHVPAVEEAWRARLTQMMATPGEIEHALGDYDPPAGRTSFRQAVATYLQQQCGWPVTAEHVVVTAGSQTGCFLLFNLLAGTGEDGRLRRVGFPMVPEYIGYADQLAEPGVLTAWQPRVEATGEHRFRYRIDRDAVDPGDDLGLLAVSRPCNPTAGCLEDDDLDWLIDLAVQRGLVLLIDNAYGLPFPGAVYAERRPPAWSDHLVYGLSLSKLGLPGTRTGIMVCGDPQLARRLAAMNAVIGLANPSLGQAIVEPWLLDGTMDRLGSEVVPGFYRAARDTALAQLDRALAGREYAVHEPDGAFFLWLHLPGLADDRALYRACKAAGLVVVPGSYFFPGFARAWHHRHQCLRLSYCRPEAEIARGCQVLAQVLAAT